MRSYEFTLENEHGLHARPAGMFIQICNRYQGDVVLHKDGQEYNGKSMLGILKMAASKGDQIKVVATGVDEDAIINAIEELIENNFGE